MTRPAAMTLAEFDAYWAARGGVKKPARRSKQTPTTRSLALLRARGYYAVVVERWNAHAGVRHDLLGFGDILAIRPTLYGPTPASGSVMRHAPEIVLVQTTTASNLAARRTKIRNLATARTWLDSGGRILLHGWHQVGPRGGLQSWECREEWVTEVRP